MSARRWWNRTDPLDPLVSPVIECFAPQLAPRATRPGWQEAPSTLKDG